MTSLSSFLQASMKTIVKRLDRIEAGVNAQSARLDNVERQMKKLGEVLIVIPDDAAAAVVDDDLVSSLLPKPPTKRRRRKDKNKNTTKTPPKLTKTTPSKTTTTTTTTTTTPTTATQPEIPHAAKTPTTTTTTTTQLHVPAAATESTLRQLHTTESPSAAVGIAISDRTAQPLPSWSTPSAPTTTTTTTTTTPRPPPPSPPLQYDVGRYSSSSSVDRPGKFPYALPPKSGEWMPDKDDEICPFCENLSRASMDAHIVACRQKYLVAAGIGENSRFPDLRSRWEHVRLLEMRFFYGLDTPKSRAQLAVITAHHNADDFPVCAERTTAVVIEEDENEEERDLINHGLFPERNTSLFYRPNQRGQPSETTLGDSTKASFPVDWYALFDFLPPHTRVGIAHAAHNDLQAALDKYKGQGPSLHKCVRNMRAIVYKRIVAAMSADELEIYKDNLKDWIQ